MSPPKLADIMEAESTGKVERPKPVPQGCYLAKIVGQPERGTSEKKGTPFIRFAGEFIEATDDVDEDDMAEWMKREDGSSKTLRGTNLPKNGLTFYTTPDALWRLDKFYEDLGVLAKGKSRNEMAEDAIGQEFIVNINHTTSDDGEATYANVKSTAPVE
jgi:hypothetical protein